MPPLRPLLPTTQGYHRTSPIDTAPPKRSRLPACESCRRSKSRCDGNLPSCSACTARSTVCQYSQTESRQIRERYEQLQQQELSYAELIQMVKTRPEPEAFGIFRRLRAGMNVTSILKHMKEGDLLLQLALRPETSRPFEFPLITKFPSHLFIASNPYTNSLLHKSTFPLQPSNDESQDVRGNGMASGIESDRKGIVDEADLQSQYKFPFSAMQMMEPLLDRITASPWTTVISDNQLFRQLISSYFCYPHPCGPFVHKDLFLEDMAAGRTTFCTPLLVNAMLTNACQSCPVIPNRARSWHPESLTYRFMAEARRLWEVKSLPDKIEITTVQAAMIMAYHMSNNGLDQVGAVYTSQAREMGEKLGLFGPNPYGLGMKMNRVRVFTAWALFSWQAMFSFYQRRRPYFREPPQIPLPDPRQQPLWHGEIWVQYPHDKTKVPLHFGLALYHEAALRVIMNDLGTILFGRPSSQPATLSEIVVIKERLDSWRDALPEPLQPRNIVFPVHLMLHVQYLHVMKSIMKSIIEMDGFNESRPLDLCTGKTPLSTFHETQIMFETVVCLYYARHSFDSYDPWVSFSLTIIGRAIVRSLSKELGIDRRTINSHRAIMVLAVQGLASQSHNYYNGTLLGGHLQSAMTPQDLQLVCTHAKTAGSSKFDQDMIEESTNGMRPVPDIVASSLYPGNTRVDDLTNTFERITSQECGMQ